MSGFTTPEARAVLYQEWLSRGNVGSMSQMFDNMLTSLLLPGTFTVATLPTPDASNLGMYAVVSDLFGDKTDKVLCSKSGSLFYWQPVRPTYDRSQSLSVTQDVTIEPLKMGQVFQFTGSIGLGVTRNITMGTALSWPGAQMEMKFTGTLLGSLNVLGTGLGSAVGLLVGGYKKFSCELVSGTLQWKQLI